MSVQGPPTPAEEGAGEGRGRGLRRGRGLSRGTARPGPARTGPRARPRLPSGLSGPMFLQCAPFPSPPVPSLAGIFDLSAHPAPTSTLAQALHAHPVPRGEDRAWQVQGERCLLSIYIYIYLYYLCLPSVRKYLCLLSMCIYAYLCIDTHV